MMAQPSPGFLAASGYPLPSPHTYLYMSNPGRVVTGSPLRFDSIPNAGTAGGTWTYRGAGAARPALQNWDDLTNVSAYFDNDNAGFLPPGSQPASSWSFLGPSSVDPVDATIALRYYDIGGAGAGMLYTASNTSDNGIRLSVQSGQLQLLVATPSSDDGTISMDAATSGLFNDIVLTKANAAGGFPTFSAYRATNDGTLSAVGTPVNVANHGSAASLTLNFGGLTTYRAIYAELRIYKGWAADAAGRAGIVAAMRSRYPVTP